MQKRTTVKVLVIGSGAAGLNAALQVYKKGIKDVLILTEGLDKGTSINTGSDKQTYYKMSLCGDQQDSPERMAESYLIGGSMHGDLALVESALSTRAFHHLVSLGVPFPQDKYGQFVGYKTDHDPLQRATSIGPYTSRAMCKALILAIKETKIVVREKCEVIELVVENNQVLGAIFLNEDNEVEVATAKYVIFAVGGPGGLYADSVYPKVHNGAIGLALMAGAKARNLPESQFGMASTQFRWNVSGTYMQVLPRVISVDEWGNEEEFLPQYFDSPNACYSYLFLKGYQWPFDSTKAVDGSSRIDLLVDQERKKGDRKVYLDYRSNPVGLDFTRLSTEAYAYLNKSNALFGTPFERLMKMNPQAVQLYRKNGIDLDFEPLEIAVCAQHNNGGLAGDRWWESENIRNFFPVGEVNGSHGVKRPGGSALNAGQVGGFRIAEMIAYHEKNSSSEDHFEKEFPNANHLLEWEEKCTEASRSWDEVLSELRQVMSGSGGFIRESAAINKAYQQLSSLWQYVDSRGMGLKPNELKQLYRTRHLLFASLAYLSAIRFALSSGVGSRGSALVLGEKGLLIDLGETQVRMVPEEESFRRKVLETVYADGEFHHEWVDSRPLPHLDHWFERDWHAFGKGEIFED